jgi:molecular chaperone GrpE (heat shock protein)
MTAAGNRQQIIAKLINARDDLEDALRQSAPAARYDPVIIPQALRNELSVLRSDLVRIIQTLEGSQ